MMTGGTFLLNVIIYVVNKAGTSINKTAIIIVCSIVVSLIAIPLLGFFIFHVYLILTGRTTR